MPMLVNCLLTQKPLVNENPSHELAVFYTFLALLFCDMLPSLGCCLSPKEKFRNWVLHSIYLKISIDINDLLVTVYIKITENYRDKY